MNPAITALVELDGCSGIAVRHSWPLAPCDPLGDAQLGSANASADVGATCPFVAGGIGMLTIGFIMSSVPVDPHRHDRVRVPAGYADPAGRPVDHLLLARLLGARLDGCRLCTELLLTLLAEDALTTARLVELCCISSREHAGGLAVQLTDTDTDTAGDGSAQFLELAAAGFVGGSAALRRHCERMNATDRRSAAASAMSVLIHQLSIGL
jgi:hypothetical protein